jgi:hypothetical protein
LTAPGSSARRRVAARAGAEVHVDRLALRVASLDEDGARALARLVADGLAPALSQIPGTTHLESLRVELAAQSTDVGNSDLIARRIIGEVGRSLARGRPSGRVNGGAVR